MSRKIKPNTAFLASAASVLEDDGALAGIGPAGRPDPVFRASRTPPRLVEADVARIERNPDQPRRHFDDAELKGLADSIAQHGLQQPIGLKQLDVGRWQLVYGERRLRAVEMLGHATVFGIIVSGDSAEVALVENIQRADLTPYEEADAYATLMERHGYRQEDMARIVGRDRADISRALSLRKVAASIREEYGRYPVARYRLVEIARAGSEDEQTRLWEALKAEFSAKEASSAASDGEGNASRPRAAKDTADLPEGAALPKPVLRAVLKAHETVAAARGKGLALAPADRRVLEELRTEIDAFLAGG